MLRQQRLNKRKCMVPNRNRIYFRWCVTGGLVLWLLQSKNQDLVGMIVARLNCSPRDSVFTCKFSKIIDVAGGRYTYR